MDTSLQKIVLPNVFYKRTQRFRSHEEQICLCNNLFLSHRNQFFSTGRLAGRIIEIKSIHNFQKIKSNIRLKPARYPCVPCNCCWTKHLDFILIKDMISKRFPHYDGCKGPA
uniref:Uncharacterized protein n=1 Tax=Cacopsylla melanoneura TaxID=428564 RepID=A0A8D8RXA3_9HEMI